jgi:hypothetical protein
MKIGITCHPTYGGSGVVATQLGIELANRYRTKQPCRVEQSWNFVHDEGENDEAKGCYQKAVELGLSMATPLSR